MDILYQNLEAKKFLSINEPLYRYYFNKTKFYIFKILASIGLKHENLYVNTHVHAGGAELISYSLFIHHPTSYLAVKFNGEPIDRVISLKQGFLVQVFAFLNKLKWRFKAKYSIKNCWRLKINTTIRFKI
ncbi:MAG: hypothetical protein IPF58_07620 [Saprospirales bacterium]|nr:hypothetical protein [Saprospirales bacterium]